MLEPITRQELKSAALRMARIARRFREMHPLAELEWESGVYYLPTGAVGTPHLKPLVWFPSGGCIWSLKGGCTMCDFGMTTRVLSEADVLHAFDALLREIGPGIRRIHIGPGGSFFTDEEVPPDIRIGIIRRLRELPFLRAVGIETRAPFVTQDNLEAVIRELPANVSDLTLGFGLECISDLPRVAAVNKGYGPEHIARAIQVMRAVGERHPRVRIGFEVYVLLKPLSLAEGEAIDEALRTIEWVFESGAETAVLFMNTVKDNTIQGYMNAGPPIPPNLRYEPPFYLSAVEVLRQLPDSYRERTVVLGPQSAVPARGQPRGCPLCTWPLNGALIAHNLYRDPGILHAVASTTCPCRKQWLAELQLPARSLKERVTDLLSFLEAEVQTSEPPRLAVDFGAGQSGAHVP